MQAFSMSNGWWQFAIMAIVSYFLGNVNAARMLSRKRNQDITKMGSGNPGTMNMSREFGWKVGVLTFVIDALKGGIPVLVAHLIYKDYVFAGTLVRVTDVARYFCGIFAVVGHIFPGIYRFKGGKGIAVTFGVFWVALSCETTWYILIVFGIIICLLSFIFITQWGSLGNILTTAIFSVIQLITFFLRYEGYSISVYLVLAYLLVFSFTLLTWCAHEKNLLRLFGGEEHRTSLKKIVKKK